jgi:sugar (pentulose or hexulose) kinase
VSIAAPFAPNSAPSGTATGIAVNEYDDIAEAVERTTTITRSYEPNERNVSQYERWYGLYKDIYETMFEHWRTREEILSDLESRDD